MAEPAQPAAPARHRRGGHVRHRRAHRRVRRCAVHGVGIRENHGRQRRRRRGAGVAQRLDRGTQQQFQRGTGGRHTLRPGHRQGRRGRARGFLGAVLDRQCGGQVLGHRGQHRPARHPAPRLCTAERLPAGGGPRVHARALRAHCRPRRAQPVPGPGAGTDHPLRQDRMAGDRRVRGRRLGVRIGVVVRRQRAAVGLPARLRLSGGARPCGRRGRPDAPGGGPGRRPAPGRGRVERETVLFRTGREHHRAYSLDRHSDFGAHGHRRGVCGPERHVCVDRGARARTGHLEGARLRVLSHGPGDPDGVGGPGLPGRGARLRDRLAGA